MEAVIPAEKVRLFAKAVKVLAKVGDVLSIESDIDRVAFRALAQSQSAFARFTFHASFFSAFTHRTARERNDQSHKRVKTGHFSSDYRRADDDSRSYDYDNDIDSHYDNQTDRPSLSQSYQFRVKVSAKALLLAFKFSLSTVTSLTLKLTDCESEDFTLIERLSKSKIVGVNAQRLRQSIVSTGALILILHSGKQGIFRTFKLAFLDDSDRVMEPEFRRTKCRTIVRTDSTKFREWLDNFQNDIEEVSMTYTDDSVRFKSFLDWEAAAAESEMDMDGNYSGGSARAKKLRSLIVTDYTVPASDFAPYIINTDTISQSMVFTLTELKLFISVCEACEDPVWVFASRPGAPILVSNAQQSMTKNKNLSDGSVIDDDSMTSETPSVPSVTDYSHISASQQHQLMNVAHSDSDAMVTWNGELILATLAVSDCASADGNQPAPPRPFDEDEEPLL